MKKFRKAIMAASLAAAAAVPMAANAGITWQFNYDDGYAVEGESRFLTAPLSAVVDELKFTAESIVAFKGVPFAPGTKFDDFIVLRIDQYFRNSANVTDAKYGQGVPGFPGLAGSHEITAVIKATGTQDTPTSYHIDTIDRFDIYFDAGTTTCPGGDITSPLCTTTGYTAADFTSLATFADSTVVETAALISGGGANDPARADGNINLVLRLLDKLSLLGPFDEFEIYPPQLQMKMVMGLTDSNNNVCVDSGGSAACTSTFAGIAGFFTALGDFGGPYTAAFHTKSDGSFTKDVPEPGTLGLLGVALAGLGASYRRRQKQA